MHRGRSFPLPARASGASAFATPPAARPCPQILNQQSYLLKTGPREWKLLTSSASSR